MMLFGEFKTLNKCKFALLVEEERNQYKYDAKTDSIILTREEK